jgi:hypothetical protein
MQIGLLDKEQLRRDMKPTTLEEYLALDLKNNHFRYMEQSIKDLLVERTPNCHGDLVERAFWLQNGLKDYPTCKRCGTKLSSRNWYPSVTQKQRDRGWPQKGYRPFCGRVCAMNDEAKHQRVRDTCIDRYGVPHALQSNLVQAKRKLTNLERYGAANPMAWSSERFKNTIRSLYDVVAVRHIDGVSDKIRQTKQTQELLVRRVKELEQLFEVQVMSAPPSDVFRLHDVELRWKHTCGHEYTSNITSRGLRFCPRCSNGTSRAESELGDWIEGLGFRVLRRNREFGFELDLYLPDLKLGIEYDGTYWHSARFVSQEKSMQKLEWAEAAGVRLITLQEHLWVNAKDLVKARLSSVLGLNQRVMGRRCSVQKLDAGSSNDFFMRSHLQGAARASISYGLILNDELIAAMSFGPSRFLKSADWELIRFASAPGVNVQGGAGRLLKAFRAEHKGSIVSYADRCWSTGNLYKRLGFRFIRNSKPSYFWVSGQHVFTRYQTQKGKLEKLLNEIGEEFHPAFSEEDNMLNARFLKVYDRGNLVWLLD